MHTIPPILAVVLGYTVAAGLTWRILGRPERPKEPECNPSHLVCPTCDEWSDYRTLRILAWLWPLTMAWYVVVGGGYYLLYAPLRWTWRVAAGEREG